jgi:uncharacterized protein YecE (DUF72 family)
MGARGAGSGGGAQMIVIASMKGETLRNIREIASQGMGADNHSRHIGTAGWTLPKQHAHHFPAAEENGCKRTHLERCAMVLNCVEINSSFHRSHMRKTWERWAAATPEEFRFAVKIPKTITHGAKLAGTGGLLETFLGEVSGLGGKLGPLLVQLPPKLAFEEGVAHEFFTTLRELLPMGEDGASGLVACEPRHASWFTPEVSRLMKGFGVARVGADPPKGSPSAATPAGWPGLRYWRLHGAPRTYYSEYSKAFLRGFAKRLREDESKRAAETWVIFDNTALGHGTGNAVELQGLSLRGRAASVVSRLKA